MKGQCTICDHELHLLRHPLRRLRGSGHWLKGLASIFTRPLKACAECGSVFTWEEELLAQGAVPTSSELKLANLRSDMSNLRDSFVTIFVASGFITAWMVLGPGSYEATAPVISGAIGAASLVPSGYFHRKSRFFKEQIKHLRQERVKARLEG